MKTEKTRQHGAGSPETGVRSPEPIHPGDVALDKLNATLDGPLPPPVSRIDTIMEMIRIEALFMTVDQPPFTSGLNAWAETNGTLLGLHDAIRACPLDARDYCDIHNPQHREVFRAALRTAATSMRFIMELCEVFPDCNFSEPPRPEGTGEEAPRRRFASAFERSERGVGEVTLAVKPFRPSAHSELARRQVAQPTVMHIGDDPVSMESFFGGVIDGHTPEYHNAVARAADMLAPDADQPA